MIENEFEITLSKNMLDHKKEIQKFWDEQENIFREIYKSGVKNYIKKIEGLDEAFGSNDRCVRCIDERTPGGYHAAGSGILLSEEKKREFIEKVKSSGVQGVYSHKGCGAAKIYAELNGLDTDHSDEYGKKWAEKISKEMNVPYKGHIGGEGKDALFGPDDFHIARAIYYDGTGLFDYSKVKELPPGFTISRKYLDAENAKKEVGVAVSIALGGHGFGKRITKESPLVIIVIGDSADSEFTRNKLQAEISSVADKNDGRVIVGGFERS